MEPQWHVLLGLVLLGVALALWGLILTGDLGVCAGYPASYLCAVGMAGAAVGGLLLFLKAIF